VQLVYDLYALSEPGVWDHIVTIVYALVLAALIRFVWRRPPGPNMVWLRWARFHRRFLLLFLVIFAAGMVYGEFRLIMRVDQRALAKQLADGDYAIVEGPIERLVLEQKFRKSDPVSTFVVGSTTFEYGSYSVNPELRNHLEAGPLRENRRVMIWHRDGPILRLYAEGPEGK
jgi:hypothetical protein